jgi:hypothetical protein
VGTMVLRFIVAPYPPPIDKRQVKTHETAAPLISRILEESRLLP